MNKSLSIITFSTLTLLSSQLAAAEVKQKTESYCNARFDYCVDVPSDLVWLPEADNGDGRHFELANSKANILIFGSYAPAVFELSDEDFLNKTQQDYQNRDTGYPHVTVTYELRKGNAYTVSGYDDKGYIFYNVIKANDGIAAQLHLDYPKNAQTQMNDIVKQMARSFRLY